MIVDLHRTFSKYTNTVTESDNEDWSQFLGQRQGRSTWTELHEKSLVVVLGEAGIGKTIEFQNEVGKLRAAGQTAFFISLNQLSDAESWQLVLTGHEAEFDVWAESDTIGFFFLDAVDEARLKSHADFEKALTVVQRALSSNLDRVRIAISSRITDWSTPKVQAAVDNSLGKPIARALEIKIAAEAPLTQPDSPTVAFPALGVAPSEETLVVSLDPLSNSEAHQCAAAFDLQDKEHFWAAVAEGDYEFMATRPLDLRWMVGLWNQSRNLGSYRELIEVNISNRLREFNESYETAGEVLSLDQLYAGAIELAAAAEFGDCAFFTLDLSAIPTVGEIVPHKVLSDWHPTHVRRLLATAVFDEASFGRVKFHHRSIREFLAAKWVAKQLGLGVPLQRLQGLFVGCPFGQPVLIASRRASLSWLAAISVTAREWVVRAFPEILLFEGDPQAWDQISADQAFTNFIDATKHGLQVSWFRSASECMRVGRVIGAGKVAGVLADPHTPPQTRSLCFHIAQYAKLADCALVSFTTYQNSDAPTWERVLALEILEFVGTAEQRQKILADLKGGLLDKNELTARALPITDWKQLEVIDLSLVFDSTHDEGEFGSGPMARVIENELLPAADLPATLLLLEAVMASLPRPVTEKPFARFPIYGHLERAWLLDALSRCFERVIALLPETMGPVFNVCMEAAERIEDQYLSGLTHSYDYHRLHQAIAQHQGLRWSLALEMAQSHGTKWATFGLTRTGDCLVSFDIADLNDLTWRANDPDRTNDERDIWFAISVAVIFSNLHHRDRAKALRTVDLGDVDSTRALLVEAKYKEWRQGAKQNRERKIDERERKAKDTQAVENYKSRLLANLAHIRDGTHEGLLKSLLCHSYNRSSQRCYSDVDFEMVAISLSPEIASAFEDGLRAYWPTISPPAPAAYTSGTCPWIALIALAGLSRSFRDFSSIADLSTTNATTAAQLAVWELHSPPSWFEALARAHPVVVEAALTPWVIADAQATSPSSGVGATLEMVLHCAPDVRQRFLAPLIPLVISDQIRQHELLKTVINTLREDGLLCPKTVGTLCQARLTSSISYGHIGEMAWLRIWMDEDAPAAWLWFQGHLQGMESGVEGEVSVFAEVVRDLKWVSAPLSQEVADVLLGINDLLRAHPPIEDIFHCADDSLLEDPSKRLLEAIPNVFLGTRGQIGHISLVALLGTLTDSAERNWVMGRIAEHASLDTTQAANRTPEQLKSIGFPFLSPPSTEAQLYEQVIARLEEIRMNLEEGPFSERSLFIAGMPEKSLQLWLAAKFRETQNRRFNVHREEEVDDDKKTDIQLSCPAGNVCVEIKPVDVRRSYSANSLTETLRSQIVAQYLKGYNSSRGILVLMQLDNKTWSIPGGSTEQPFTALVDYLKPQAESIKRSSAGVSELTVFGIRCVV
ncbi:hypothetical protein [Pseudomonas rhodesiae]|uniref:hypothetical protein n=1 Tax=Pseudomonas rhodesiae TaxID=76760 RepID=UPI00289AC8FD|nr:hypothetical protein [Pseudomonas rhodesiae]